MLLLSNRETVEEHRSAIRKHEAAIMEYRNKMFSRDSGEARDMIRKHEEYVKMYRLAIARLNRGNYVF